MSADFETDGVVRMAKELFAARAEIARLTKRCDAYREALRLYGHHSLSCPAAPGSLQALDVCQCGLDAALAIPDQEPNQE